VVLNGKPRFGRLAGVAAVVAVVAIAGTAGSSPALAVDQGTMTLDVLALQPGPPDPEGGPTWDGPVTEAAANEDFSFVFQFYCDLDGARCDAATITAVLPREVSWAAQDVEFAGFYGAADYDPVTGTVVATLFTPLLPGTAAIFAITVHFPTAGMSLGAVATQGGTLSGANFASVASNQVSVGYSGPETIAPEVALRTPRDGADYRLGQAVTADYSCIDDGGAGLSKCGGTVADGSLLDTSAPGIHDFTVTATDNAGNVLFVSRAYSVSRPRPDGRIKGDGGKYVGDAIYNSTGARQTSELSVRPGKPATYLVSAQNDAPFADRLRLKGIGSTNRFTVRYTAGGVDITSRLTAGTYQTPRLPPGKQTVVKVVVTASRSAPPRSRLVGSLVARSSADPNRKDTVRFITGLG
jgi:hypothetical protein